MIFIVEAWIVMLGLMIMWRVSVAVGAWICGTVFGFAVAVALAGGTWERLIS